MITHKEEVGMLNRNITKVFIEQDNCGNKTAEELAQMALFLNELMQNYQYDFDHRLSDDKEAVSIRISCIKSVQQEFCNQVRNLSARATHLLRKNNLLTLNSFWFFLINKGVEVHKLDFLYQPQYCNLKDKETKAIKRAGGSCLSRRSLKRKTAVVFNKLRQCGDNTAQELAEMTVDLFSFLCHNYFEQFGADVVDDDVIMENVLNSKMFNFEYQRLFSLLSQRAKNVLRKADRSDYSSFLSLLIDLKIPVLIRDQIAKCSALEKQVSANQSRDEVCFSSTTTKHSSVPVDMSLFTQNEITFINSYHMEYGHWPMFYILQQYLIHSNIKNEVFFTLVWGLSTGTPSTLQTVGDKFGCSRERIRQILNDTIVNPKDYLWLIVNHPEWEHYDILKAPYLFKNGYDSITVKEHLNFSLTLPVLFLFHNKELLFFNSDLNMVYACDYTEGIIPVIVDKQYSVFELRKVISDIRQIVCKGTDETIAISIREKFVENKNYWKIPMKLSYADKTI